MNLKVEKYNKLSAKELNLFFDKLFELILEEEERFLKEVELIFEEENKWLTELLIVVVELMVVLNGL